jgi:hypothetical protein
MQGINQPPASDYSAQEFDIRSGLLDLVLQQSGSQEARSIRG